jgi:integrase
MPKLTDRFLAALSMDNDRKDRLVFDTVSPGLGVRMTAKGTRTFIVQWTDPVTKRKVREPLGIWGSLSIDQARVAAKVRLGQVAKGINPRAERLRLKAEDDRERAEAALSFEALVDEWGQLHLAHRRKRYREEAQRAIKHTFADLLKRPAARIARAEIINVLDQLVRSTKAVTAARSLAYARAAFNWAVKRGKVPHNPFVGLPVATVTAERERALTDFELADVWAAIETMGYPWGPFFCIAILTLQRREEVAAMRWSEIAPDLSVWTMSGARMKNGKQHDVHLSRPTQSVLRALSEARSKGSKGGQGEICDFVFSTTGKTSISGFSRAKARLDAAMVEARAEAAAAAATESAPFVPWRLHDLRRTGASTLARLGFDTIAIDKLLAHQPTKLRGVAAIYQRYDFAEERVRALDAWAEQVLTNKAGRRERPLDTAMFVVVGADRTFIRNRPPK